jgi:hypothetical protein
MYHNRIITSRSAAETEEPEITDKVKKNCPAFNLNLWVWRISRNMKMVPLAGLEPALLAEPDFESGVSTNSTIGA